MSSIFDQLAKNLAKQGAPVLGGIIGSAIGGPAGTVAGSIAGKAIEALADSLGTDPTAEAVNDAITSDPSAASKVQATEAQSGELVKVWLLEAQRAADNDAVEREKGFGAWHMRRTITSYVVLVMLASSFGVALAAAVGLVRGDVALLTILVGHAVTIFMTWNGLVSGGRAVKDAVAAWRRP